MFVVAAAGVASWRLRNTTPRHPNAWDRALVETESRSEPTLLRRGVDALALYHGKELRALAPSERALLATVLQDLDAASPPCSTAPFRETMCDELWYVWRLPLSTGGTGLVALDGRVWSCRGSSACFTLYDQRGVRLSSTGWVSAGSRRILEEARILDTSEHGFPCIELRSDWFDDVSSVNGQRQHYALLPEGMDLVHLAGQSGATVRDESWSWLGPFRDREPLSEIRSATDWERSLMSSNPAEILRTLHWLALRRDRTAADRRVASAVRDRVRPLLHGFTGSPDPWIRESAELALHPDDVSY
jgi:hypothetical protein